MSSGRGFSTSGFRCRATPIKRSPPTTSSIKCVLCEVSTSNGATMPGKITMSDKPSTGTTSGTERGDSFPATASAPAEDAPKILMNSVSGEVILRHSGVNSHPVQKTQKIIFPPP